MNTGDPHGYLKRIGLMGGSAESRVTVKRHSRGMPSPGVTDRAHEHTIPCKSAAKGRTDGFGQAANTGRSNASYNAPGKTGGKSIGRQGKTYQEPGFKKGQGQAGAKSPNKLSGKIGSGMIGGKGGDAATNAAHEHTHRIRAVAPGRVKGGGGPSYNKPGKTGAKSVKRQGKTYAEGKFKGTGADRSLFGHLGHLGSAKVIKQGHNDAKTYKGKSMAPGGGGAFAKLKDELSSKPGISNPGGLAAKIGRQKYGKSTFQKMSARGRRRAAG